MYDRENTVFFNEIDSFLPTITNSKKNVIQLLIHVIADKKCSLFYEAYYATWWEISVKNLEILEYEATRNYAFSFRRNLPQLC